MKRRKTSFIGLATEGEVSETKILSAKDFAFVLLSRHVNARQGEKERITSDV